MAANEEAQQPTSPPTHMQTKDSEGASPLPLIYPMSPRPSLLHFSSSIARLSMTRSNISPSRASH